MKPHVLSLQTGEENIRRYNNAYFNKVIIAQIRYGNEILKRVLKIFFVNQINSITQNF